MSEIDEARQAISELEAVIWNLRHEVEYLKDDEENSRKTINRLAEENNNLQRENKKLREIAEAAHDLLRYTDPDNPQPPALVKTARFVLEGELSNFEKLAALDAGDK